MIRERDRRGWLSSRLCGYIESEEELGVLFCLLPNDMAVPCVLERG